MSESLAAQPDTFSRHKRVIDSLMCEVSTVQQMQTVVRSVDVSPEDMKGYPLLWPVDARRYLFRISSGFGMRRHPLYGGMRWHNGVDIALPLGTPVYAAGSGQVIQAGYDQGYGWVVEIRHEAGFVTRYAHLDKVWLSTGDHVAIGEHLGSVGRSGAATGYHLHYEVYKDGKA